MSSEFGNRQNPRKILQAINGTIDKGNSYGFDREIFEKDESKHQRPRVKNETYLQTAQKIMIEEIKDYFMNHQPEISFADFWTKCVQEP